MPTSMEMYGEQHDHLNSYYFGQGAGPRMYYTKSGYSGPRREMKNERGARESGQRRIGRKNTDGLKINA